MTVDQAQKDWPIIERVAPNAHGVTGKGRIPTDVSHLCTFLVATATVQQHTLCDPKVCADCLRMAHTWWEYFISLTAVEAGKLKTFMLGSGIDLPYRPPVYAFLDPTAEWSD